MNVSAVDLSVKVANTNPVLVNRGSEEDLQAPVKSLARCCDVILPITSYGDIQYTLLLTLNKLSLYDVTVSSRNL